jgi:RHS repeat-associated protein
MNQPLTYSATLSFLPFADIYTFSAKERDPETGLSYFGSRYYSSDLSIWLSVDPMTAKYPSLSPYTYCADNPVLLVDPNGEEWEIDGYVYTPGGSCPEEASQSTKDKWNTMNSIYETEAGKTVINEMNVKGIVYKISSEIKEGGSAAYLPNSDGNGGTIYTNGKDNNVSSLSHEIFHGYQYQKGQGGRTIFNNVEAYLFAEIVSGKNYNLSLRDDYGDILQEIQVQYVKSLNNIRREGYNQVDFDNLVNGFKASAYSNKSGVYDDYPLRGANQKESLIAPFLKPK